MIAKGGRRTLLSSDSSNTSVNFIEIADLFGYLTCEEVTEVFHQNLVAKIILFLRKTLEIGIDKASFLELKISVSCQLHFQRL